MNVFTAPLSLPPIMEQVKPQPVLSLPTGASLNTDFITAPGGAPVVYCIFGWGNPALSNDWVTIETAAGQVGGSFRTLIPWATPQSRVIEVTAGGYWYPANSTDGELALLTAILVFTPNPPPATTGITTAPKSGTATLNGAGATTVTATLAPKPGASIEGELTNTLVASFRVTGLFAPYVPIYDSGQLIPQSNTSVLLAYA
jgi:hypothetical protein